MDYKFFEMNLKSNPKFLCLGFSEKDLPITFFAKIHTGPFLKIILTEWAMRSIPFKFKFGIALENSIIFWIKLSILSHSEMFLWAHVRGLELLRYPQATAAVKKSIFERLSSSGSNIINSFYVQILDCIQKYQYFELK